MNDLHLVLHGLAIKRHAGATAIAGIVGLSESRVVELLAQAHTTGRTTEVQGADMLTPAGRMILDGQYAKMYATLREDPAIAGVYARFERINAELKQLITDWQTIETGGQRLRNDHSNKAYDARVLDGLGDLHERFSPILNALTQRAPRLAVYGEKLQHAL
ncbi:MAG: hypothetical protein ACREXT_17080, partial [Gammaproteobacteria bacterium]